MTNETVADALDAAADKIERDGWYQGDFFPGAGEAWGSEGAVGKPVCVMGALFSVCTNADRFVDWDLNNQATLQLGEVANTGSLAQWNDTPGRTEQEVLDALRLAAKGAEGMSWQDDVGPSPLFCACCGHSKNAHEIEGESTCFYSDPKRCECNQFSPGGVA
jgi:hypothetical protein